MRFETHAHSMYSNIRLVDCINKPEDLIRKAAELGLAGITLTDHESLSGHVDWLNAEKKLKKMVLSHLILCVRLVMRFI